ncbi:MAG: PUA domain-containing protein [Candidatus Thorarchaeota archaeon]
MELDILLALRKARGITDYQFGSVITDILFSDEKKITFEFSKNTGKIKHIRFEDKIILNFRPNNGFFTLTLFSAKKIIESLEKPTLRAIVLSEISEFIKKGRNVFCKHIIDIDDNLRPLDEVIVVNQEDELLAIGRLMIPVPYVKSFKSGIAINVRKGVYKSKI